MSLDRKLTIKIDGNDVNLFMSYGVLEKLLDTFPPEQNPIETAMFDSKGRKSLFDIVLKQRGNYGVASFDPEVNDIEVDDVEALFNWAASHVSDFFLRSAENAADLMKKSKPRLDSLTHLQNGSNS